MAEKKELWERVAYNIGKELAKYYLYEIYDDEKVARLYNRRFDRGKPIELVNGNGQLLG